MVSLYASVGEKLTHYHLDVDAGTLQEKGSVSVPAAIQYVWPHGSKQYLYVSSSDTLPPSSGKPPGTKHHLTAFKIAADGALSPHGEPFKLPLRPVHQCLDMTSTHVLVAFPVPSGLRVYKLNPDGHIAGEVEQPGPIDAGIFAHQVRVTPDNKLAILVTRGNDAAGGKPEDPGALKVFKYKDGILSDCVSIAPNGGFGFGPRHLDFHPTKPWICLSIERQNEMQVWLQEDDHIKPEALFSRTTLIAPYHIRIKQWGGAVHVHPKGHTVYGTNRAFTPVDMNGRMVLPESENNLVVYRINRNTGDITAIQHIDTPGVYCRCFHIDPSGRMLVASSIHPMDVMQGDKIVTLPASLSLYRIADDGRLTFVRKYDIEVGDETMFWIGMV